jgi:cytochrome P450
MLLLLLLCFVLLLLFIHRRRWLCRLPAAFPPGPAPLPIIGNIHQVGFDLKAAFDGWRRRYGPVVGFRLGSQLSIVISDFNLLNECFKDDRYCGRPANLQEIFAAFFGNGTERSTGGIVFSHGEYWREQRKFAMKTLKDFGVGKSNLQAVINDEVAKLVEELREEAGSQPVDLRLRTNLAVVNSLWQILNGEKSDMKNPKMRRVFKATTEFIVSNSLSGPVMIMPWLRHLPFFSQQFETARRSPQEMREVTSASIKGHLDTYQEEHQRDFIDCYIKKMRETTDTTSSFHGAHGEGNIQRTLMDLFGAGSETTSSILYFAFNYLIRYPEMQARVHAEIDAVIGSRTPLLEDRAQMPYTDAVIHEVLRHSCIVYTTPHATTEEVELAGTGYILPAGTAVYANVWWIMNDPAHWERPETFMPERFLDAAGRFRKNERCIPFLIGKRYCLGQQLAQHELFLFLTGLMQKFSFRTPLASPELVNTVPEVGFMHTCPAYQVLISERS